MAGLKVICAILLLYAALTLGHDTKRINFLDRRMKNKLRRLRNDIRDELLDTEEKIISNFKSDIPELIQMTVLELLRSGQLEDVLTSYEVREIQSLKQSVKQLKVGLQHVTRKLALSEEENERQKEEIQMIGSKLKNAEKNKNVESKKCHCVGEYQSNGTSISLLTDAPESTVSKPIPPITNRETAKCTTQITSLLAVGNDPIRGQFYQIDLKENTKEAYPLLEPNVIHIGFHAVSNSIIWSNYSLQVSHQENGIYSMNAVIGNVKMLAAGRITSFVILDDTLFYSSVEPKIAVYRMNLETTESAEIASELNYVSSALSMVLNEPKQKLYSCHYNVLHEMDFDGGKRRVVYKGDKILAVTLDPDRQILYFVKDGSTVMRLKLDSTDEAHWVIFLRADVHSMLFHEGWVYFSDYGKEIRKLQPVTKHTKTVARLKDHSISICLFPQ